MSILDNNLQEYHKTEFYKFMPKGEFDYSINISTQSSYIYFETAKVACTSIKKTLKCIEAEILGVAPPQNADTIHEKNILLSPSSIGLDKFYELLNNQKIIKFAFVRNPYTRVLSGFLDKIYRQINLENKARRKFTKQFGLNLDEEINFKQFLCYLQSQPPRLMDHHWRPQTNQLLWGTVDYDYIGSFEYFEQDFQNILEKIYAKHSEKNKREPLEIKKNLGHQTNASYCFKDFYDDEAKKLVENIYQEDFKNFNYKMELPLI